jgi:aminopeptidase N
LTNKIFYIVIIGISFIVQFQNVGAQSHPSKKQFTHQDTLRGSVGIGRDWWNVMKYDISVKVDIDKKFISGYTDITYKVTKVYDTIAPMQIDLQQPMQIDSVIYLPEAKKLNYIREGNVFWITSNILSHTGINKEGKIRLYFSGKPHESKHAPWDGGWVWVLDDKGRPWVSAACQGLGASVWYPCKDHQSDEPDNGATLSITVPDTLVAVGNGRLSEKKDNHDGTATWKWAVANPINNYLIIPYIGKYVNFTDSLQGEKGNLDLSYWVLDYNLEKAKKHFQVVQPMIHCYEYWMGPYPFYEDSYKLVDAPYLGMEHQSAVAYGNNFLNGYLGEDRSYSGWGKDWDFIIVHESGHEWFANNITSKDIADMWIHESFTTYSETFFVQWIHGLQAANEYVLGQRKNISNYKTMIAHYGVNEEGGDLYDKGANMLHTIRQIINNDVLFRGIIRGLNKDFYHQTVTTRQIENYISQKSGIDFSKVFDQYLRTTKIPVLEYKSKGKQILYKWTNCVTGFNMAVKLRNGNWIKPVETFKTINIKDAGKEDLQADPNFYIVVKRK